MGEHEIQSNVHSLVGFCSLSEHFDEHVVIALAGGIDLEGNTAVCRVRDTVLVS